jgi:hypothetical protein
MDLREDVELEVSGSRIPQEDMEADQGADGNDDEPDDDINNDDEESDA